MSDRSLPPSGTVLPRRALPPVGAARVAAFADASGDDNPLHRDADLARRLGFSAPPVHGMLLAALIEDAIAEAFTGASVVAQSTRFLAPVPADAALSLEARIVRHTRTAEAEHAIVRAVLHAGGERPAAMAEVEIRLPGRVTD